MSRAWSRRAGLLALAAGLTLLTAACGGSSSAGSGGSSAAGRSGSTAAGSGGAVVRPAAGQKQLAYSQCMRKHGVPGVPSSLPSIAPGAPPSSGPHWAKALAGGPDPNSPRFLAAQQACRSLEPPPHWVAG
ncbi:MAG TPA: hypothetical protein VEL03_21550 [Streptosporangiaceae bacterium]|nr:hypothetical protein [Streptosporangiaceae bacterium]